MSSLPQLYAEGKVCLRNTPAARKYLRMLLTYQVKGEKNITNSDLLQLMEVIAPGEAGKEEIRKWITMDYGLQKLHVAAGQQVVINTPYENIQAAESLFQLDTDAIGSGSVEQMLAEYRRGAAAGNAYAQYKLGEFYRWGHYVEKDTAKCIEYLTQAAQQRLYVGIDELTWVYSSLRTDNDVTKKQAAEYERLYLAWIKRQEEVKHEIKRTYADAFTGAFDGAADNITYGCAVPQQENAVSSSADEEYVGHHGKDSESPFTVLNWPSTITGPHGVVYHLQYTGMNTADYRADTGEFTTLHLGDRGAMSAHNSDGYFYW